MGLRSALAGGPAPTFVIPARGGRQPAEDLRLDQRLRLLDSPRAASVLLIVGRLTERLLPAAMLAHDQMAAPRATVHWVPDGGRDPLIRMFPSPVLVPGDEDASAASSGVYRELLRGRRSSSPPIYPDVPPVPWRRLGPYGQGGKGMSGGVPYGRPLAGRASDRDGLELDALTVDIGPLFSPFPPGLILRVRLQGDVVQEVTGWENVLEGTGRRDGDPFHRALARPIAVADVEQARARHHLRWLSRTLRLHGLPALGTRVLALACRAGPGDAEVVAALRRRLERSRSLAWATRRVGVVAADDLPGSVSGPVLRAGGIPMDLRADQTAYRDLGFEPVTHGEGDARARWRQRLAEAEQALDLAARAGDRVLEPTGRVASPRGELRVDASPSGDLLRALPRLLAGREWGEAVTLVHDLDLDMEEVPDAARLEVA